MKCYDCPRACGADRDSGVTGYCGGGRFVRVAKYIKDFTYEEPCLGTVSAVFFGGCSLRCLYCQNHKISRGNIGTEYNDTELAELFCKSGNAIDLVTPTHYLSAIERAAESDNKKHSFIYNTSGYETESAVTRASAFADVFLTDFKYADDGLAERYSDAPDYRKTAVSALKKMRQIRDEYEERDGVRILKRGVIVRHLVLPGHVENSVAALDIIADTVGTDTVLSLMSQFTPNGVGGPNRKPEKIEYKIVAAHAAKLGFRNGYLQEFTSSSDEYIPDFDCDTEKHLF